MRGNPARFSDFTGGLNTDAQPYLVGNTECRDCRNVLSTSRGSVVKRDGCSSFGLAPTVSNIDSLYGVEATSPRFLVGVTADFGLFKMDTAGVSSSIKGALSITNSRWEFIQAPVTTGTVQGPVYGANGVDAPIHWTGTGNAAAWTLTAGTIPNPKYLAYAGNRVFMANLSASAGLYGTLSDPGSAFCFSDIGNPRTFPASNIVLLDPGDGDAITGVGKVGPYLLVFKRRKTFVIYDTDTGANRRLSDSVGCCSHRSIAETPRGTFFLTQDRGVYSTDGQRVKLVSDKVSPTLASVTASLRDTCAGAYFNDHYYLSVALTGSLDRVLDFDFDLESWWVHDTTVPRQWALWRATNSLDLYGAAGSQRVLKMYVSGIRQDNGVNFESYWKGPWQTFGAPFLRKRMRQVHFDAVGPFDFYIAKDFGDGDELAASAVCASETTTFGGSGSYGSGTFGDGGSVQEARVYSLGVGRAWSAVFKATTNTSMVVDSYTLAYTMRRN